jgi:GTPase KRas protein
LCTEDSYSVTRNIDGQNYFLMLTDTAGQEEYRSLWAASNLRSDAFLLVYDITQPSSLDALDYFMEMIDMEEDSRIDNGKVPPVRIVAGNKCDLQGARQVRSPQGLEWARRRKCGFMETSAREMVNIEETFARKCHYGSGDYVMHEKDFADCDITVLVRRVVEARRIAAQGGPGPIRTAALPPVDEKDACSLNALPVKSGDNPPRQSWWHKLKCW